MCNSVTPNRSASRAFSTISGTVLPSRVLRTLIFVLIGFFTIVYPLSGLATELAQQNAFNMLLQVGLILYITGLSLYVGGRKPANDAPAG